MEMSLTIYTIGHSNHSFDEFCQLLEKHNIELVCDVRRVPYSKYSKHFQKGKIALLLKNRGFDYIYRGQQLGGVAKGKTPQDFGFKNWDDIAASEQFKNGVQELIEISNSKRIVVMCAEEDPGKCHRHHLIATQLMQSGVKVFHIRKTGNFEEATPDETQLNLF